MNPFVGVGLLACLYEVGWEIGFGVVYGIEMRGRWMYGTGGLW